MCIQICVKEGQQYAATLLENGSRLLREALGLWDMLVKPHAPHNEAFHVSWCASLASAAPRCSSQRTRRPSCS